MLLFMFLFYNIYKSIIVPRQSCWQVVRIHCL